MERRDALNRMRTDQLERLNAALASRYAIEREREAAAWRRSISPTT